MRVPSERKLAQILIALLLLISPAHGKPLSSRNSELTESNGNANSDFSNSKLETDTTPVSDNGHNNLLSDLARISKDEDVGNKQTIVGTEASAATVKNSKGSSAESAVDEESSNTRTTVTSSPTETESTSHSYPAGGVTESAKTTANANNDMNLVKLSEPAHIVLSPSKDEGKGFSKLITSNENSPESEEEVKSNDAMNKQQGLSPLISERTDSSAGEDSQIKDSSITGSYASESTTNAGNTATDLTHDSTGNAGNSDSPVAPGPTGNAEPTKQRDNDETNNVQAFEGKSPPMKVHNEDVQDDKKSGTSNKVQDDKDSASDHVIVCAGEKQTISCPPDTSLSINSANYGYDSNSGCPVDGVPATPSCQANGVYPVIKSACHGQASCLLQSDGQEFGGMCPGQNNLLKVGYSCENTAPATSSYSASSPQAPASPQLPASPYAYQNSPYIPHPLQTQTASYSNNAYNQPKSNTYNGGYMNDNAPGNTNYPYYGNYGNQGYYNYYNQASQGRSSQAMGNYYGYKPRPPARNPAARYQGARYPAARNKAARYPPARNKAARYPQARYPAARYQGARYPAARYQGARYPAARNKAARYPQARYPAARYLQARHPQARYPAARYQAARYPQARYPAARYQAARYPAARPRQQARARQQPSSSNYASLANTQYRDYNNNKYPQAYYNNYYNTRNRYYGQRYSTSPSRQSYLNSQYPRNSYLGSCYACQNCQQCSEQAYCQGCPKCKHLACSKKTPKDDKYMDPIDSLVEEFGKKTKGMTPMEMSAVVISPVPKDLEIAHSLPLRPPTKTFVGDGDDGDDDDDDSDENEFTLSDEESNNHEIQEHEKSLNQKKTSVTSSDSSETPEKDRQSNKKAEESKKSDDKKDEKHNEHVVDDDDDDDGYDVKIKKSKKEKKPKRSKINRHKHVHYSDDEDSFERRKRLSKSWYGQDEDVAPFTDENPFDMEQKEGRRVESPYYYDAMFW